jgi:hypothetical protein
MVSLATKPDRSLATKLVRSLAFAAGFAVVGAMITPSCTYRRCEDARRRCDESCFYRCDRSGCYPVCGVRCRTYCYDYRNSAALADNATQSEPVTTEAPTDESNAPAGGVCEYDDDCSGDLRCVEREGKDGRACEALN